MNTIIIADDHPIVRRGLREIVEESGSHRVLEADDGAAVLSLVAHNKVDLVLMDISMPGRNGLEVLGDLKREYPRVPVIILTIYPEEQYAVRAMRAGADGYLTKKSAPEELASAITKVLHGGKYVGAVLAEKLASEIGRPADKAPHELLSDREYQVMRMLGNGRTLTEVAEELSLSVKTVSTYRARILEKMNLKHNADITRYVFENQLQDQP